MLENYLEKELDSLEKKGLRRELKSIESSQGPKVFIDAKEYLNFCSNNYLGLANSLELSQAAIECIKEEGIGAGASRLVCGNMTEHVFLEKEIADFKETESAILFNCGYMANVGIISSLFSRKDIIFSDRLNHASIVDGILLSRAECQRYPHCDMEALENMLKTADPHKRKVIISDSIFSMDGDLAPLDQIVSLAKKYHCIVMIDEAHAFGVMGKKGKGLAEYFGVENDIDVQMGTLSKAAGVFGAYCCGPKTLMEYLRNKARSFIYTTALPPSILAASRKALEKIRFDTGLRERLWENVHWISQALKTEGFDLRQASTPIIPIIVKDSSLAVDFSNRLFDKGIFVSAIRPPTVPEHTARLRLTITAAHTQEDMAYLVGQLKEIGKELNII